ncbi:MAG: dihydrolipoyl dehydrogenase [Planctomycetota bacterium]|jgi:dihydrolipoamide dehydrogenase
MAKYDVVVIGAGPGGYVAAIKAAQNGKSVALIERDALGGVCLNWGCIPTKALLKSAEVFEQIQHAEDYGITVGKPKADFSAIVARSRDVAAKMSAGIQFLMSKNKVGVISGSARVVAQGVVEVTAADGAVSIIEAGAIVISTGARPRTFPNLPVDGERVFHAAKAMSLPKQPKSLLCIGAGAIGMEFGYFYSALGTEVHVVEVMDQVLPVEDREIAGFVEKSFVKQGIKVHTQTKVSELKVGKTGVTVTLDKDGEESQITVERVLVAVGMQPNTEDLGLHDAGISTDARGFIAVDANQQTNVPGVYAIGDVAGKQLLAHKASFEGEAAIGHICGHPQPVDYSQIPGCTYCQPQVASVGLTEAKAKEAGHKIKVGRFQFAASGKAKAIGRDQGFVKLIFDAEHDQLIGAHLVGGDATELLAELGLALKLECTASEILHTVHAHPTLSEAVMEAAGDALGICVHQ